MLFNFKMQEMGSPNKKFILVTVYGLLAWMIGMLSSWTEKYELVTHGRDVTFLLFAFELLL